MEIRVPEKNKVAYGEALNAAGFEALTKYFFMRSYGRDNDNVKVEIEGVLTLQALDVIEEKANELEDPKVIREVMVLRVILKSGNQKEIRSLKGFQTNLELFLKQDTLCGWLYKLVSDNVYLPYLIVNVRRFAYDPHNDNPARVVISFDVNDPQAKQRHLFRNNGTVVEFFQQDIVGKTVPEILANKGFFHETPELYEEYLNHLNAYKKHVNKFGTQFLASGVCNGKFLSNEKMVNNEDAKSERNVDQTLEVSLFEGVRVAVNYFDEDTLDKYDDAVELDSQESNPYEVMQLPIPFHPFIRMFSLKDHKTKWVLGGLLSEYAYDQSISEKLILPEDHNDLIDILVNDSGIILDDIILGKKGGTVIMCRGEAGLGKTLTAQVYSEKVCLPLYEISTGILGSSPREVDENLEKVLERATAWKCIVLIDESDLFVRARGDSLSHNAIVATFLRQLESYEGILFLTTNRFDIDDAILSRCAAVITYKYPNKEDLRKLWRVLGDNYEVELSDELIDEFVDAYPKLAGRDVKALLKLMGQYVIKRKVVITIELLKKCIMFRGITTAKG